MAILAISDSFDTVYRRKYIFIYIESVSMASRLAAATSIVPQNTGLTALAMGMEELGPVQLRLMLDEAVPPKIDWLARRGLLHNTHMCVQCHFTFIFLFLDAKTLQDQLKFKLGMQKVFTIFKLN